VRISAIPGLTLLESKADRKVGLLAFHGLVEQRDNFFRPSRPGCAGIGFPPTIDRNSVSAAFKGSSKHRPV